MPPISSAGAEIQSVHTSHACSAITISPPSSWKQSIFVDRNKQQLRLLTAFEPGPCPFGAVCFTQQAEFPRVMHTMPFHYLPVIKFRRHEGPDATRFQYS